MDNKIDIDVIKLVTRTIARSDNLDTMGNQLTQVLVSAMEIKGATIFALNPDTEELEILASFGLSIAFVNKGPVLAPKSIGWSANREAVVISDVSESDRLQYPDQAKDEGIAAIVSIPVVFHGRIIGALRLYQGEVWEISDPDLDALNVIAENIGMAMMYTRILNALQSVKNTVNDVHTVWLETNI